jgi:xanthine/CO dehydrogenase XdhC/CoxF family maturation factor
MSGREQPWSDETPGGATEGGRVVVVSDNPIGQAVVAIAGVAGRRTTLLDDDPQDAGPTPLAWLAEHPLTEADGLVLCDHDAPQAAEVLRRALDGEAGYVAMMGSRRRAAHVFAELAEVLAPDVLARLHVPAGLDIGGKAPGEIALSVVAEIVAVGHGRSGGPMTAGR